MDHNVQKFNKYLELHLTNNYTKYEIVFKIINLYYCNSTSLDNILKITKLSVNSFRNYQKIIERCLRNLEFTSFRECKEFEAALKDYTNTIDHKNFKN